MENMIQVFENKEFGKVRTIVIDGEPWLVGKDVALALGYTDTFGALKKHIDKDDRQNCQNDSFESPRGMTVINESGVYALIFGSKLPTARKFKKWVTGEVLPSIRKHGAYVTPQTVEQLLADPDTMIKILMDLKQERAARLKAEQTIVENRPKVIFAEAVESSDTSILVGELAKLIKQNGVEIGEKRLFTWLRDNGYLMSRKCSDWNMPTQKSMELGLFEINERNAFNPDGSVRITKTPRVTGKGQTYFINKFLSGKAA